MSHLHNIDGYSAAATAQYQEYLESLRAIKQVEREREIEKKARAKRFERLARRRRDSEEEGSGDAEENLDNPREETPGSDDDDPGYIGQG